MEELDFLKDCGIDGCDLLKADRLEHKCLRRGLIAERRRQSLNDYRAADGRQFDFLLAEVTRPEQGVLCKPSHSGRLLSASDPWWCAVTRKRACDDRGPDYPVLTVATKRCSKCGKDKPLAEFRPRKSSRDGLHGWCNPCYRDYYSGAMRRWRDANRKRSRQNDRRWRERNPVLAKEILDRYDAKNPNRKRDYMRKRRATDPEAVRATYNRWRARNREQEIERCHRRRVAIESADPATVAMVAQLLTEPCAYCGATENITIDHVVPLSRGGKHEADNLAPACYPCNCSKNSKLLSEWDGRTS